MKLSCLFMTRFFPSRKFNELLMNPFNYSPPRKSFNVENENEAFWNLKTIDKKNAAMTMDFTLIGILTALHVSLRMFRDEC